MEIERLREFLEKKVEEYNQPAFIPNDPISIPHQFSKKQDIEIAGFFAAIFSWGNRTTIIQKSNELMKMMDNDPYSFCLNHGYKDLKKLSTFKHRTFNSTDLLYFVQFLQYHFQKHDSLEDAFVKDRNKFPSEVFMESVLNSFYHYFFSLEDPPQRTRKHIACPEKKSTCKRLNMFLRWMVRHDKQSVDFGIWKKISASELICPIDIHVSRVAKKFGLLTRKQTDWLSAIELTQHLRTLDKSDPAKYDFALFGLGVIEHY